MYILIGLLLGSIVTSTHDNREACEGRAVLLREKGAVVECRQNLNVSFTGSTSSSCWYENGLYHCGKSK